MENNSIKQQKGFTLVELMVVLAIIGVLLVIAVPLANSYRMRAEYANIASTLRYLMDGQEAYFLDKDSFYPAGSGSVTINRGQEMEIYELAYNFPAGHKHRFVKDQVRHGTAPPKGNQIKGHPRIHEACWGRFRGSDDRGVDKAGFLIHDPGGKVNGN